MRNDVGQYYLHIGDYQTSQYYMDKALVYDPDDAMLRNEYALLLAALNRQRELLEHLAVTRERLGRGEGRLGFGEGEPHGIGREQELPGAEGQR